jgi:hypothetical protein
MKLSALLITNFKGIGAETKVIPPILTGARIRT